MGPEENKNKKDVPLQPDNVEKNTPAKESPAARKGEHDEAPIYENLDGIATQKGQEKKISFLYDVKLGVNVELGRASIKVKDILSLQPGSLVELNRLAGDPVEIIVNEKLIARGEVIVIDDNFAVRVTDILSQSDIVKVLGQRK